MKALEFCDRPLATRWRVGLREKCFIVWEREGLPSHRRRKYCKADRRERKRSLWRGRYFDKRPQFGAWNVFGEIRAAISSAVNRSRMQEPGGDAITY
jgi:hypothetical protein